MKAVRPFPWANLDATNHREIQALSALRQTLARHVEEAGLLGELSALAGTPLAVRLRRVHTTARSSIAAEPGVAVLFADADRPSVRFAVEAEGALAATMVAGALKLPQPPRILDMTRPVPAKLAGAFAALLATAARRAHGERPLRVLAAGGAAAVLGELEGGHLVASFSVLVGDEAFLGKLVVPRDVALAVPDAAWSAASLASMGNVLLSLPVVAFLSLASRAALSSLRPGDAWMPGASTAPRGPVFLAAPSSDRGVCADIGKGGLLVLRGDSEDLAMAGQEEGALVENLGELPVVVRVEIGMASMRARDWASLRPGDVIALGSRIGEPVTLRVGGVEVARGELVDVEGEAGVRILSCGRNLEGTSATRRGQDQDDT